MKLSSEAIRMFEISIIEEHINRGEFDKAYQIGKENLGSLKGKQKIRVLEKMLLIASTLSDLQPHISLIPLSKKTKMQWLDKCISCANKLIEATRGFSDEIRTETVAYLFLAKAYAAKDMKIKAKECLAYAFELAEQIGDGELKKDIVQEFRKITKTGVET